MNKKTNIRIEVFETNSSSTHSFCIAKNTDCLMDTIPLDTNNNITLTGGEFGWGWEKYNDALTKANYCVQDGFDRELLSEVIKEQTGAENIIFLEEDIKNGYIDHKSVGTTSKINNKEELRQFIFNPKSWLYIGNDNIFSPVNFFDEPGTVYTDKITIESFNLEAFFKEEPTKEQIKDIIEVLLEYARFNETKNIYESRPSYSTNKELYYKYSPYHGSKINFYKKTISLIKEIHCYNIKDRKEAIAEEERLRKLPENRKVIHYTITKL